MNILIITENYTKGGLETQIATYYSELRKKHNLFFAIGNYEENRLLPDANIEVGFHFRYEASIGEFISDVNRLVDIVNKNKIDVIHVHPFYSLFQAIFVAQLTKKKLIYTYHGPGSLTFTTNIFDEIMFEYAIETSVSSVLSVSEIGVEGFLKLNPRNIEYIPNAVDNRLYKKTKVINNRKWALVSRLDSDKYVAIENLIKNVDNLDIDEIDIWGEGNIKDDIQALSKKVKTKINIKGFSADLSKELLNNYNGVIGIGRAAMEGLLMGYPVMLVGNEKNCGIINDEFYEKTKKQNFTARTFNEKSVDEINIQLKDVYANVEKYDYRDRIISEFGIENVARKYIEVLEKLPEQVQNSNVLHLFADLINCDKNINFHNEYNLLDLLNKHIYINTNNIFIKNKIMILNNLRSEKIEVQNRIAELSDKFNQMEEYNNILKNENKILLQENTDKITMLAHSNSRLEYQLNYLSNNITTKTIIKNNIRKFFNIFRKNKRSE